MKNHYLKIIIGSILMLITAGSFNFQSDKSIYLTKLENSKTPKSLEFKEVQEVAVSSPVAIEKEELPETFFASNEGEGQIGVSDDKPIDNPIDNIFHVNIKEKLRGNENIWLEYELKGVQDYSGISRSINDQLSVGGYLVKKSDNWVKQKELINPNDLKSGDNVIRFTIADNNDYGYQIRNLGIRIEPYNEVQSISNRRLVVNQPSTEYYYGKLGYFQGLVIGEDCEKAKVLVNGEKIRYQKGTFESLVEKPINSNENWTVRVQAIFPDGQELYVDIPFNKPSEWDYTNGFDKEIHSTELLVTNTEPFELQLANAKLKGDSGCIDRDTKFSITALRDIDVPALDAGMVNVTAGHAGYRFLPHGTQFSKNVFVDLAYDTTKIPQGYTEHDIKTYFFDETSHHWVALPKDTLLLAENTVKSITYHFTDMINGIIKVPESPETQGYTPTSMKDVKAANPATGINLINPPTANSMGNANLSYPLNIPAGRQGMQPQLAISYNSGGGNGWLGLGWDLSVPSISVDTRWGVPRFDSSKESETYVLSGQQLSPVSHRSEWEERSSEKQFFPRIEGSYSEIIRHGDKVNNYWWEVTDKNGIKYFYGGHPDEGVRWDALLADEFGNISNWMLVEVRDLNENFVRYKYDIVVDMPNLSAEEGVLPLLGRNLYISKITYTGHGDTEGKYSILFTRDRSLGGVTRKDYIINARYGFKQLTADLLRKIEIQYDGTNIRSYKLEYKDGAFYKTLLESITEYDSKRVEFSKHEFQYFDDVKSKEGYKPFASEEVWNTYDDEIKGDFGSIITGYEDKATAISGTRSNNWGAGVVATTGPGFDTFSKNLSSGSGYSYSESGSKGLLALVDINGDGLSDKLIVQDEKLFYRPQLLPDNNGKTKFSNSLLPVEGSAKKFLKETSYTNQFGFEVHIGAFFGTSASGVTSKTSTYFSDVNADGLIDIVDEGKIYFNRINANGNPEFSESSENSPNPIVETGSVDPDFLAIDPQELEDAIDQNPLHDAVRMWQAPFDGTIDITSPIHLIQDFSSERLAYSNADGVRVAVQLNGNELWSSEIEGDDYQTKNPTGISSINVNRGDRIYFRVQSRFDGAYDNVSWNPTIQYSQHTDNDIDANNKAIYKFNAEDDFILVAKQTIGTPIDGRIKIDGDFIKPITSDDIKVEVIKLEEDLSETILWDTVYTWDSEINEPINLEIDVDTNDVFTFKVSSSTNIDWGKINWMPHSYYIDSYDPDFPSITDVNGNPTIESYAVPEFSIYANQLFTPIVWEATENDTISIAPLLKFNSSAKGKLIFSVKGLNKLIAKQTLTIDDSIVSPDTISVIVNKGDKLFIDYHTIDTNLVKNITGSYGILSAKSTTDTTQAGLYSYISESFSIFGQMYRNWGQFVYNGNRDRALQAINEADLKVNDAISDSEIPEITEPENYEDLESQFESANIFNPREDLFILMVPNIEESNYQGYDENTCVRASTQSSSRLGKDNISYSSPYTSGTANLKAIEKKSMSLSRSYSWAASLAVLSYGNNSTTGTTNIFSDFMDMNGDRYPDVVSGTKIQYTEPHGGLSEDFIPHEKGVIHSTEFESEGTTFGARYTMSSKDVSSDSKESSYSISGSASTSGSYGDGSDEALFSWMDINGDGLTDRVHKDGIVELNLGYRFAPKEIWGYTNIRKGESDSKCASGGVSVNINNSSFESGVGKTRSDNKVIKVLQDINGDGLVDEIVETDPLKVRLNLGNGFSEEISWGNQKQVNVSSTIGESLNTAFTVGFNIWFIKVCINGRSILNRSFNRQEEQVVDIDGDGFPDYISSDKESELKVYRSTIGKTNLLKSVKRPLRANFELAYEKVGNTFEMPKATWALSEVKVYDGHQGDGADYIKTSFEYENGYQDRHEREFYGFNKVKTNQLDTENNDANYRTTIKEFANNSYYTKGLLLSEIIQDANGNKFIETVNEYRLKNRATMQDLPDDFEEQGINIALPALVETNKYFYEGNQQAQKSTKMTFAYGDYGNVVAYTDFGDPDITEDNISSTIDYWGNLTDKNILSVPKSITVTGGDGKTYRKRETSIDDAGKITQIRQYLKAGQPATYDLFYNDYGNLDSVIQPANYNGDRMYFAYNYDNVVHSYITNVRDAYGYNSSSTYEYRFGQVESTTDINGQQTLYEIDDLGRITKITGPYELESGQDYTLRFAYHPNATTPWAHTQHYDPAHPDNPIETAIFIDGMGRVLQTKKDGAIFNVLEAKDEEVMLVSGKVIYDAFGRSVKSYYPVSENKGSIGKFNSSVDGITPTKVNYDILNRTKTTILPDIATTEITYGFGEDRHGNLQFMTIVKDAEMKETTSYTDIKGLQTAIKAPGDVWTSFVYNPINELKEVTDAEDNVTVSEYDMFGRRISRDHPDAGLTEYTYDLSGNMLTQTTANLREENKEITYEFDYSRLININYPQNPENNVRFEYGEFGADYNRAGRIVVQEDATGAQEFFYGNLGEITKNLRTIIVPDDGIYTFVTEWQYDTWNRLTSMIYPDGEELTYEYNTGGLLQSMFGKKNGHRYNYLNQLGYDKFEDRVYLAYGNGTETTYNYEAKRRRLHNITAKTSAGRQMMNNTYSYDNVNNIVKLKNEAPIPTDGLKGGASEYNYVYDDLYRLDYAEGKWQGESHEHRYTLDMEYSATGSIERKNQSHDRKDYDPISAWVKQNKTTYDLEYKYEGEKPHAPTKINEITYSYDANGNQTGWQDTTNNQHREILWDEENRIRAIADNGLVNHYIYDASGERVIKSNGDGQVVKVNGFPMGGKGTTGNYSMYVNPFMVVNSMKFTKHFYIEGQRIVSKLGDMGENQELLNPKDTARAGNNGNHPIDWDNKQEHLKDQLIENFEELGLTGAVFTAGKSGKVPYGQIKKYFRNTDGIINDAYVNDSTVNLGNSGSKAELLQFYYHPDHLGSSNFISDVSGEVYQHMEYFPFGETFIEERNGTDYTNYLYNGKEFDEEIGLYYYGARYYDPRISMWYGVDPMMDKHPDYTPYAFCYNNPVKLVDPFGLDTLLVNKKGKFAHSAIKGGEHDVIVKVNNRERRKGEINYKKNGDLRKRHVVSQNFENESISAEPEKGVFGNIKNTLITTKNNEESEGIFNFLADNTDVEFSHSEMTNENGISENFITSSHDFGTDTYGSRVVGTHLIRDDYTLNVHTHKHPVFEGKDNSYPGQADYDFYKEVLQHNDGNTFKIKIRWNGVTKQFKMKK